MGTKKLEEMSDAELDNLLTMQSKIKEKTLDDMSDDELDQLLAEEEIKPQLETQEDPSLLSRLTKSTVEELPMIGGTIGGVAGLLGGAGIGAIPMAGAGAGLGEMAKGMIKDYAYDEKNPNLGSDVVKSAAFGMIGEGSGQAIGKGVEKALPLIGKGLAKAASATSGLPEDVIINYAKNPEGINDIIKKYGSYMGEAADELRQGIQDSVKNFRQSQNEKISSQLASLVDAKTVPVSPVIIQLESAKRKLDPRLNPQDIEAIDSMIKTVYSMVNDPAPSGMSMVYGEAKKSKFGGSVSPDDMFKIQNYLREQVTYKPAGDFFPADSNVGRAFKGAAATARKQINSAAPDVAAANNQLSQLHALEDNINMNLVTPGKTDATVMAAGSGANMRNQKNLRKLGELIGEGDSFVKQAKDLSTARSMANPDFLSALGTGRAAVPLFLGNFLGDHLGALAGGMMGLAGTPIGVKTSINVGSKLGNIASKVPQVLREIPGTALSQKVGQMVGPSALDLMSIRQAQAQEQRIGDFPINLTQPIPRKQWGMYEAEVSKNPNLSNIQKSKRINLIRNNGRIYLGQ